MANHLHNIALSEDKPQIYVACLASYNNGILYGEWLDPTSDVEDIQEDIKQVLAKSSISNAEEFAVHDYSGFRSLSIGEYEGIEQIHEKALFIVEHGELGAELISINNGNLEKAKRFMDECYLGEYESRAVYATELFNQHYLPRIPEDLQFCINCDCVKEAVFIRQSFSVEVGGKTHVFKHLKKSEFNPMAA